MNEKYSTPQFEERIRQSFGVPEIRSGFVDEVYRDLMQRAAAKSRKRHTFFGLRPAWAAALAIFFLMMIGMLMIGPQRVYAEFLKLIGYIPGVGIVDQSRPVRVLAEPVSLTRDGITVTVTSATLTGDRAQITYRVFGVPRSAYPDLESAVGCRSGEYLRLADGTQLAKIKDGYEPVPGGVNEVVFVIPCISDTLPGKAPENWELPLRFVPAPPDLTVMPVFELTPSPQSAPTQDVPAGSATVSPEDHSVSVTKVIETGDGYILIGNFQPPDRPGESFQQIGAMEIHDARGKKVAYTWPLDLDEAILQEPGGTGWAAQFGAAGLVYPLTIDFSGVMLFSADAQTAARFTFDAGSNPQPGQKWDLNRQIQLDDHILTLHSITADSQGSYLFSFQVDPKVYSIGVQIAEYTPVGGGGGGGGGGNGNFTTSLAFESLPTGVLTVTLSNLVLIGDSVTWEGQWSPAPLRTDLPANPTLQPGVCLSADSLERVQPAPAGLFSGKILMYEALNHSGKWGLILCNPDGSGKQTVAADANWGIISPDGRQVAYPAADGIRVMDLVAHTEKVLPGVGAFNMHWSPDGKQIAYVSMGNSTMDGVFVVNVDGTPARRISDFSYASVIGWSPDDRLYFAVPYAERSAWKVFFCDLDGGETRELFTIENGTSKFLNPRLSPDGKWIAYRGQDNSSLYLVHPDGSDMHLVLDNIGANGIAWTSSGWLGVSIRTDDPNAAKVLLINPDSCASYSMNGLQGQLEGLVIK